MKVNMDDWRNDTMADEGKYPVTNPVWQSGKTSDPVMYTASYRPSIYYMTLAASPPFTGSAKLRVTTAQSLLIFPVVDVYFTGSSAFYDGAVQSQNTLPASVANLDLDLSWEISFDSGQTWSKFANTSQKIFVTLGPARGFQGSELIPSRPTITAARLNKVTFDFSGLTTPQAITIRATDNVTTLFGFDNISLDQYGNSNPWALLDNPPSNQKFDCVSQTEIALVQIQQAGVDAGMSFAFPTTEGNAAPAGDATKQKMEDVADGRNRLIWYLADGAVGNQQALEAFIFLNTGGTATEARTVVPKAGPYFPLAYTQGMTFFQNAPPDVGQLAFSVMYSTLKLINQQTVTPPRGGKQWWVGPLDHGPVDFPIN